MAENCNLHPQAEMGTRQMGNVGFVCFGEVNTPFERLQIKHDAALKSLRTLAANFVAVSYTHLDVYKRQRSDWLRPRPSWSARGAARPTVY